MIALALGVLVACAAVSGFPGPHPGPRPSPHPAAMPYPMAYPAAAPGPNGGYFFGGGLYEGKGCPLGFNCDKGGCPPFLAPYPIIKDYPFPGFPYQ